jgi:hypothetical protein
LEGFKIKNPFKKNGENCGMIAKKDLMEFLNSLQFDANVQQE